MKQHQRTRYLEKRGDGFYWRRRLPKIRNYQTNLFLTFSLRTDIPSNARDLAARLTALTTLAFDYAKGCYDLKLDMLRPLLTDLIRFEIAAFEKARLKIDEETTKMIRRFIDVYRPVVLVQSGHDADNEHLFVGSETERKERGESGSYAAGFGYQCKGKLCQRFKKHMAKYCMIDMDFQVMRHIAGKVILDMNPSAMSLVQELLGHKKSETTRSYYAEVCKLVAQKNYLALLDRYTRRVLTNVDFHAEIEDHLKGGQK
ncbi:hypothetical protein CLV80_12019 [Yoonia maritima]|uniref:Phage integrase family protein n=1 Tax=Yoonia maritima TaxID=1435347 RepID=A0A2T0VT83_9RHOB|nr:hypothetical protein [Yoonia maritima]PRY74242.1 hypothetical protein CLV80_12019 [Yoonia maritima]